MHMQADRTVVVVVVVVVVVGRASVGTPWVVVATAERTQVAMF